MTDDRRMVWLDLEMTGLDPDRERILEVAALVTDAQLQVVAEGPDLIVHQSDALLGAMDDWNREHHGASGLTASVRTSTTSERDAEAQVVAFLRQHCQPGKVPLAGNSVHQDRLFLRRYMPTLDAFMHYRIVDVSSVKELVKRWYPDVWEAAPKKKEAHRAMDDIRESLAELRYYRAEVFR